MFAINSQIVAINQISLNDAADLLAPHTWQEALCYSKSQIQSKSTMQNSSDFSVLCWKDTILPNSRTQYYIIPDVDCKNHSTDSFNNNVQIPPTA